MPEFHPSLLRHFQKTQDDSHKASWSIVFVGWGCVAASLFVPHNIGKLGVFGVGWGAVQFVAAPVRRISRDTRRTAFDIDDAATTTFQQHLLEAWKPKADVAALPQITAEQNDDWGLFDWNRLRDEPDNFPHPGILAPTGGGKTTLAEWIMHLMSGNLRVITTKRKKHQWRGLHVVGVPRDFEVIRDAFKQLVLEMQLRTADLDNIDGYAQEVVAVDEMPAIAANLPRYKDEDGATHPAFQEYLLTLLREARETRIRLVCLFQGQQVKTLGIEGQSDLRECITMIRLGKFALKYAQELVSKKQLPQTALDWLKQQERPCMVEDQPAVVPNLMNWIPPATPQRFRFNGGSTPIDQDEPEDEEDEALNPSQHSPARDAAPSVEGNELEDDGENEDILGIPDEVLARFIVAAAAQHGVKNQTEFIEQLWGIKRGGSPRYRLAVQRCEVAYRRFNLQVWN